MKHDLQFHIVFADDIRREDSGKLIIIGVYDGGLVAPIPSASILSYWIEIKGLPVGDHQLEFRTVAPGGGQTSLSGNVRIVNAAAPVRVVLQGAMVSFVEPGMMQVFATWQGDEYRAAELAIFEQEPVSAP